LRSVAQVHVVGSVPKLAGADLTGRQVRAGGRSILVKTKYIHPPDR
jgi:hypothetical protein